MKTTIYDKSRTPDMPQPNEVGKRTPQKTKGRSSGGWAGWLVPVGLILLVAIPLIAGAVRITQLAGGAEITPENARFFGSPLPVVVHIVCAAVFAILGAFQFVTSFRRRNPGWHRVAGRVVVACGLLVGVSGLWMTLFYPRAEGTGDLLYVFRLFFGSAMIVCVALGFAAIRRRDVSQHRAWMMRGYAIGLGAGTQVLTLLIGESILGSSSEFSHALLMGAGWVINLAVAEWILRRRPYNRARLGPVVSPLQG